MLKTHQKSNPRLLVCFQDTGAYMQEWIKILDDEGASKDEFVALVMDRRNAMLDLAYAVSLGAPPF